MLRRPRLLRHVNSATQLGRAGQNIHQRSHVAMDAAACELTLTVGAHEHGGIVRRSCSLAGFEHAVAKTETLCAR